VDERRQSAIEASPRIHLVTRRTPGVVELRSVHIVRVLRRGDAAQRGEIARYIAPSVTWSRVSGIARSLDGMHLCRRPNRPTVLGRRRTDLKRANSSGHGRPSCSRTPPQPRAELGDRLLPLPAKRAHFRLARARVDLKQRHFGQALQEPREQQPLLVPRQRIGDGDSRNARCAAAMREPECMPPECCSLHVVAAARRSGRGRCNSAVCDLAHAAEEASMDAYFARAPPNAFRTFQPCGTRMRSARHSLAPPRTGPLAPGGRKGRS